MFEKVIRDGSGPDDGKGGPGRRNGARKGKGGPRSSKGKKAVRLNPLRHGVLSQTPVIPLVEKVEDWLRLRAGVFEWFGCEGTFEEALGDRIAGLIWRLYRVQRFERESVQNYLREVPRDWRAMRAALGLPPVEEVTLEAVAEMDAMLMARLLPGDETLDKVMRYETKLHRFLLQTQHQLEVLKGRKKAGPGSVLETPHMDPPGLPAGSKTPMMELAPRHDDVQEPRPNED